MNQRKGSKLSTLAMTSYFRGKSFIKGVREILN